MFRQVGLQKENFVICHERSQMEFNEACLNVVNNFNTSIVVQRKTTECYKCDLMFWQNIDPMDDSDLAVDTEYTYQFGLGSCMKTYSFKQHGVYRWVVDSSCQDVKVIHPPDLAYTPLLIVCGVLVTLCVSFKLNRQFKLSRKLYNKMRRRDDKDTAESEISEATTVGTSATTQTNDTLEVPQIFCVQVFRGLVILLMMLFNGESSRYWFFRKSSWNGIMPADFVHPWFLWGVGAVFYLKYRAALLRGSSRLKVVGETVWRTLKYIVLGVCLSSFENDSVNGVRYPGELQRCGVLHLILFVVEMTTMKKDVKVMDEVRRWKILKFQHHWIQYILVIGCLIVHALITYMLPVPGCPTGYTGPGGAHMHSKYPNCTGGAARYIDISVFGAINLDNHPLCEDVYHTSVPFDSEGLLGTLNCFLTMFSGVYAAGVFVHHSQTKVRLSILLACGVVQSFMGALFCSFSKEGGLPLNGQLWSVSFALLTSGAAFLVLALLHVLVDVSSLWLGSPLFEIGLNTMLMYSGQTVLRYSLPFSWTPIRKRTYTEFVIMDVIMFSFWICIAKLAFKHKRVFLV